MKLADLHGAIRQLLRGGDFVLTVQIIEHGPADVKIEWSVFVPGADLYFRNGDPARVLAGLAGAVAKDLQVAEVAAVGETPEEVIP